MSPIKLRQLILGLGVGILILLLIGLKSNAAAAPAAQFTPFPTPTPGSDGRIIYIAQKNDTAWRIAAIFGISLNELRALNRWGENPIIQEKQEIILGFAGPAQATAVVGPSATPAPLQPTPSPLPGWGNLCVILYNDQNGNSNREEEEPSIPGGAISITDRSGDVSKTANSSSGLDPICFNELPEGSYNVSVAVPGGYNPTTGMNQGILMKAGDTTYMAFGAQANTQTVAAEPAPQGSGKSPILGIAGGLLLVSGIGLGVFAGRLASIGRKGKESSNSGG